MMSIRSTSNNGVDGRQHAVSEAAAIGGGGAIGPAI